MEIEIIDKKTIKVILSLKDMNIYDITYEEMDYDCPKTRKVIIQLLKEVKFNTSRDLVNEKLFIEAFPYIDGGCILYVNIMSNSNLESGNKNTGKFINTPLIFKIDNINKLAKVCENLLNHYNHLILKSSLILMKDEYYLLIYSYFKLDNKIIAVISEYGEYVGCGEIKSKVLKEHGKIIIPVTAIEKLVEYAL